MVHDGSNDPLVIAWASQLHELPPAARAVVRLAATDAPDPIVVPDALGSARARRLAATLSRIAADHAISTPGRALPEAVALSDLLELSEAEPLRGDRPSLRAPIGVASEGVVELDLVRDGPHAVIAGTTGTGKSELLVSWVLAMASRHPPSVVTFLLIDFKGGAAFAPLTGLPHLVGMVTDLDARRSRRAIESLRAELTRRERVLAGAGARSIDELSGPFPRLVIVVDEFAAVVAGQPELHDVFADLAARGRSLGLHLVLCTQRPSGVIRDAVLANVTLRLSLRVTDRGDSVAMLGSDAAFDLAPLPRGRAVIADGTGSTQTVQLALAGPVDAARAARGGGDPPAAVWCEPLPAILPLATLDRLEQRGVGGIPFGRLDLPVEQRQPLALYDPSVDGHLLVLGASRAGRSTTLGTLARDPRCRVLPADPADAWTCLEQAIRHPESIDGAILLIDDLDLLVDRFDPELRHDFVDMLARLARESRKTGIVACAQRLSGSLHRVAGLFDSRLLLRQQSREEHVLAGGDGSGFDPRLPPGSGTWCGGDGVSCTVQVAIGDRPLPSAAPPELPRVHPEPGRLTAVVAGRPREACELVRASARGITRVVELGTEAAPTADQLAGSGAVHAEGIVLLGDPDTWQAEWATLVAVRREHPMVFIGCTAADVRAVSRVREQPPPLGGRAGECWLVESGAIRRAVLG